MKKSISTILFLLFLGLPKSSFAIVNYSIDTLVQDSLMQNVTKTKGDRIAHWGMKSSIVGTALFVLGILLLTALEFQMRGGFLLLLLYGSFIFGPILGILGLCASIIALSRKDTTKVGQIKARSGLFVLLLGILLSTVLILAFLG